MKVLSLLLVFLATAPSAIMAAGYPSPDGEQLAWIGGRIFANECNSRPECLTAWNEGEDFPSLGIGHFIWYRPGQEAGFTESFPALLRFLEERDVVLPAWIRANGYASPWENRRAFQAAADGPALRELRTLLRDTMDLQAEFIVRRFDGALAAMLEAAPASQHALIEERFLRVANAHPTHGPYALIDYVNFKGEGVAPAERYQDQGWGLRQVLENMEGQDAGPAALQDFVASAREILARRVRNAPPERNEGRWLAGWHNRVGTYLPPAP